MEFTVNLPSSKMTRAVDYCGVKPGRKVDKIKEMNFTMKEGTNIDVPYIDECPISIECKVKSIIPLGTHDLFIADVVGSHVDSNLIDEKGKIHFEEADLITYCHGEYFKMDKFPLGKFGYSVAKKPVEVKKIPMLKENDKNKSIDKHTKTTNKSKKKTSSTNFKTKNTSSKTKKKKKTSSSKRRTN